MEIKTLFPKLVLSRSMWTVILIAILMGFGAIGLFYISGIGIYGTMELKFLQLNFSATEPKTEHDRDRFEFKNFVIPSYMLIAAGALMISAGVLGVCAVAKNSHVILAFAMASYCPVLFLLAASGALSHYFKHELPIALPSKMESALKNYRFPNGTEGTTKTEVNELQSKYLCCGVNNFTDWVKWNEYYKNKQPPAPVAGSTATPPTSTTNKPTNKGPYLPNTCCWGQLPCQMKPFAETDGEGNIKKIYQSVVDAFVFKKGCYEPLLRSLLVTLSNISAVATCYLLAITFILFGVSILMCRNVRTVYYLPVKRTSVDPGSSRSTLALHG